MRGRGGGLAFLRLMLGRAVVSRRATPREGARGVDSVCSSAAHPTLKEILNASVSQIIDAVVQLFRLAQD